MNSFIIAALIATVSAAPLESRILKCTSFCGTNEPVFVTADNAREVATACFQETSFTSLTDVSHHFYLDSVNGSCTKEVFTAVQSVVNSLQLKAEGGSYCKASCRDAKAKVSREAAAQCISYQSPPFMPFQDSDDKYNFYAEVYQLKGRCSFKQSNDREAAVREKIQA
jgi:hypothetical protein